MRNKIPFIAYIIIFIYSIIYLTQTGFGGFPIKFVTFINAVINKNNNVPLDYFSFMPLFSDINIKELDYLNSTLKGLMISNSYFPNLVILYLIINSITNLSPQNIMFLPIGTILILVMWIYLIKNFVGNIDCKLNILLTIVGLIGFIPHVFYVHPIGYSLLFLILICIKNIYNKDRSNSYFLIYLISFLSLAHYWHTLLFFSLFFIISLGLFSVFIAILLKKHYNCINLIKSITYPLLICLIISISFNHLWQGYYLSIFIGNINLLGLIPKIFIRLMGKFPFEQRYIYEYTKTSMGRIFHLSLLTSYISASLMLIISILHYTYHLINNFKNKNINQMDQKLIPLIFSLSLITAETIQIIAYSPSQSIDLAYVMFYPLFSIYLFANLNQHNKHIKRFLTFFLIFILLLNSINFAATNFSNNIGRIPFTKYEDTQESYEWISLYIPEKRKTITDFNTMYRYLQREARYRFSIDFKLLTTETYSILVGDTETIPRDLDRSYVAIDRGTMLKNLPVDIRGSRGFLLKPMLDEINNCYNQHKLYEDNHISIFMLSSSKISINR